MPFCTNCGAQYSDDSRFCADSPGEVGFAGEGLFLTTLTGPLESITDIFGGEDH